MQLTWREALGRAWGSLTGVINEGSASAARWLFFLIFLLGSGYAGYSYYKMQELREEKYYEPAANPTSLAADRTRLAKMVEDVRAASTLRVRSFVWADSMRGMAKNIFDDPTKAPLPDAVLDKGLPDIPRIEEHVEPPPGIVVKAIMLMGKSRVAVMDVDGVGSGLIVRQGNTFLNGKGRVVRITSDKVVVRWNGKNWNIAPGF